MKYYLMLSQFKQKTSTALDRRIRFLKHNRNKTKRPTSAAKLSQQASLVAFDDSSKSACSLRHSYCVSFGDIETFLFPKRL